MSDGYGPNGLARAIVLTVDNLGEASALERGTWSARTPLGEDPSVTTALPRLLDALDDSSLNATFFVEGVNCELNPEALAEIAGAGTRSGPTAGSTSNGTNSAPTRSALCSRGRPGPSPLPAWTSAAFDRPAAS